MMNLIRGFWPPAKTETGDSFVVYFFSRSDDPNAEIKGVHNGYYVVGW